MPKLVLVPDWVIVESNDVTEKTSIANYPRSDSKNFSELRLNPAQLNNLNLSYLVRFATEFNYRMTEGFVDTRNANIKTYFKLLIKNQALDFVVFQVVSDIENPNKINNLAFINDVINGFKKNTLSLMVNY